MSANFQILEATLQARDAHNPTRSATVSDSHFVTMAQSGDRDAYTELVRRHQANCSKVAFSILRDWHDAEDEVQNALWKAFEHIGQFQQDSLFSTWLTRIVVNQCLMRLRQTRRARFLYIDDVRKGEGEDLATIELRDWRLSPEQEIGREEAATLLHREVRRIPPLLRSAFVLRDVEQLPMSDVAERLGISVAAAKSRLLRARVELRRRMATHSEDIVSPSYPGRRAAT